MNRRIELPTGSVRTLTRWIDVAPDPLQLYRRLSDNATRRNTLLLESADASSKAPVQSLLVADTVVRATARQRRVQLEALSENGTQALEAVAERFAATPYLVECRPDCLELAFPPPPADADDRTRIRSASPLDVLRALAQDQHFVQSPARGCLICAGVFAYDLLDNFEPLPPAEHDPLGYPDYLFWLSRTLIRIDHRTRRTQAACHVFGGSDNDAVERAYHDASRRLEELIDTCTQVAAASVPEVRVTRQPVPADFATSDLDDEHYAALVEQLKERIRAGDVFQIVPSRTFRAPCPDPLATYAALRKLNPSPYMFYVAAPDHTLFGASPEAAVKVRNAEDNRGRRIAEIRPIAGTRPRGHRPDGSIDRDLDNRLEVELRLHEKEVAEHMMLIDLARNDIARVSKPGTRHVDEILTTERYSHVMHLVSNVRGELVDDLDALHAYQASMNMGTLVGAPKVRAAQLLREHEPGKRGPYGGAVGYLSDAGELDTAIIIRSALVRDDVAYVRAGAGVVYDSDPVLEADETRRKATGVLTALAATSLAGDTASGQKGSAS